jgi:hypothetical protein
MNGSFGEVNGGHLVLEQAENRERSMRLTT